MDPKYILAHELGTSANKAVITTLYGDIVTTASAEYPLYHPQPEYAEEEPGDWWNAVCSTTRTVLAQSGISPSQIAGVVFSSQTQCLIPMSKEGIPLHRSIIWLDGRSAKVIEEQLWTPPRIMGYNIFKLLKFLRITGGTPGHTGKDQIGKILWLRENKPEIFSKTAKYIDAKDFLIYKLTGNYVTSVDLAVIWWLLDTRNKKNQWHPDLCKLAGITPDNLSEVRESGAVVGTITPQAAEEIGLIAGTRVINGAGDLTIAAVGSGALDEGELHINLGTSNWVAGHFSKRKIDIPHYTGCIGSAYPQKYYLGMAHQETAGVCYEWLKEKILKTEEGGNSGNNFEYLDSLAEQVKPGSEGLLFTPWMYGERCPLDDSFVRAGFYNIGLNHTKGHLVRAVLEGIALNTRWAMETLENLYSPVTELRMIGGGAKSSLWCQIMADVTNRTIHQVADPHHAGAKGISLLASMVLGFIPTFHDIKQYIKIKQSFQPNPANRQLYDRLFAEFKNVYKQNKKWYRRMNRLTAGGEKK
jgi:xylulokinase